MAKPGFTRNAKAIANILHNDPGGQAAVRAAAAQVSASSNAERVDEYHTDRFVCGVVVNAADQAENGSATRAAADAGLTPGS